MKYLIIIISLFSVNIVNAQMKFAVGAGYNNSNVLDKHSSFELGAIPGRYFHITPSLSMSNKTMINLELMYKDQGYKLSSNSSQYYSKSKILELMPQIQYEIHNNIHFYSGIGAGILMNEKFRLDNKKWKKANSTNSPLIISFDISLGAKLYYKNLYFNLSYNLARNSDSSITLRDQNGNPIGNINLHDFRTINLGIAYQFYSINI